MKTNDRRARAGVALGICIGALAPVTVAQDGRPAEAVVEKAPSERLEALQTEFQAWRSAFFAKLRGSDPEEYAARLATNPAAGYLERFQALAEDVAGTDAAAEAWISAFEAAVQFQAGDVAGRSLEALVVDHAGYGGLAQVIPTLRSAHRTIGARRVEEALGRLLETSPLEPVRASAVFTLARILGEDGAEARLAEARALLEMLKDEYGETLAPFGQGAYGELAERNLYELMHLQVGMVAPEVESVDATGAAFRLSDYRGKVVLVDFWGFW